MTENFTNEIINLDTIPKIDAVNFQSINKKYYKVVVINLMITFVFIAALIIFLYYSFSEFTQTQFISISVLYLIALIVSFVLSNISFKKKQFAFREHDVLFKSGVLATNIAAIPINRIQHITLQEGWISRIYGLATIKVFTASSSSGDINIPGIDKNIAEDIKLMLMGKINTEI